VEIKDAEPAHARYGVPPPVMATFDVRRMKHSITTMVVLIASAATAYEFRVWEPDAELLAKIEPVLKQHCWDRSDQRRRLADADVHVDVDADGTNIVVHMPDISVQDTFTIRGLAYTNYHRRITGITEEGLQYLECLFSPTPITNKFEIAPIAFDSVAMVSSALPEKQPVKPVHFRVHVDVEEMRAFDKWDWLNHKNKKTSNNPSHHTTESRAKARLPAAGER